MPPRLHPASLAQDDVWQVAVRAAPRQVVGEGEPYTPTLILWVDAAGRSLHAEPVRPEALPAAVAASMQVAIEQQRPGGPRRPSSVRVNDNALAEALRVGHPGLVVEQGPTPEVEAALAALAAELRARATPRPSYLAPGLEPGMLARVFAAAAELYRARPWEVVPDDEHLLGVHAPALGLCDAVVSVTGQLGRSPGVTLFESIFEFDSFQQMIEDVEAGVDPTGPAHLSLTFDARTDLAPELRAEIAAHRWPVAGARAYPVLSCAGPNLSPRTPKPVDAARLEAVAQAVALFVGNPSGLRRAWDGGPPITRDLQLNSILGTISLHISTHPSGSPIHTRSRTGLIGALARLSAHDWGEASPEREALDHALLHGFEAAPEGAAHGGGRGAALLLDLLPSIELSIAELSPADLRMLLLEVIPNEVVFEAAAAPALVAELRAFFAYLGRAHGLPQADRCLASLSGGLEAKLVAALSDHGRHGLAKSLVMAGAAAGHDMTTMEGIERWAAATRGQPLPPGVNLPTAPPLVVSRGLPGGAAQRSGGAGPRGSAPGGRKGRR